MPRGYPPQSIHLTGNSGIDNLLANLTGPAPRDLPINLNSQATPSFGIVTIHRRENRQSRLHSIASALLHVSTQHQLPLLLPLHPSPELAELRQLLGTAPFVRIIDPLPYRHMAWLQAHAAIALTDSGGIQEECATLGTPVVILRDETERMEAVDAGRAILAGAKADAIIAATAQLLAKGRQPRSTLFGDGHAGPAIAQIITRWLHAQ